MKTTDEIHSHSVLRRLVLLGMCCLFIHSQALAQDWLFKPKKPEPCGEVFIDLTKGTINGLKPDADYAMAKQALPGCTEVVDAMERMNDTEEYLANSVGFRFYFSAETLEVWNGVKAKTSVKFCGKKPKVLDALFGESEIKGDFHRIYKTDYGSLYVSLDKRGKIDLISMHTTTVDETWKLLCMDSGHCR